MNKTPYRVLALLGALAMAIPAGAADTTATPACPDGGQKVLVTGSAIKRCARLAGAYTLDTPSPVFVIGRGQIDRSGQATTIELLRSLVPATH